MRIGWVEVDEVGVLAFRQLDVRPGGKRERSGGVIRAGGNLHRQTGRQGHNRDLMWVQRIEGVQVRERDGEGAEKCLKVDDERVVDRLNRRRAERVDHRQVIRDRRNLDCGEAGVQLAVDRRGDRRRGIGRPVEIGRLIEPQPLSP